MEPTEERLVRIEAQLLHVLEILTNKTTPKFVSLAQAMELTGCPTRDAQYRWLKRNRISSYEHGKYTRLEITNRVAQLQLLSRQKQTTHENY